jgi:hypothetical protein
MAVLAVVMVHGVGSGESVVVEMVAGGKAMGGGNGGSRQYNTIWVRASEQQSHDNNEGV